MRDIATTYRDMLYMYTDMIRTTIDIRRHYIRLDDFGR